MSLDGDGRHERSGNRCPHLSGLPPSPTSVAPFAPYTRRGVRSFRQGGLIMGSQHPVEQPNEALIPSERLRHLRQRFEAAWAEAGGGPPPVLDAFLQGVVEPERSVIRGELEQIERRFRSRLGADPSATTEETLDAPDPG